MLFALISQGLLLSIGNNQGCHVQLHRLYQKKSGHGNEHIEEWCFLTPFLQGVHPNILRKDDVIL